MSSAKSAKKLTPTWKSATPLKLKYPRVPLFKTDYIAKQCLEIGQNKRESDTAGDQPILDLVSAQRILAHTTNLLAAKREWATNQYKILSKQWQDLSDLEIDLKNTFKETNKFIKANEDKKRRVETSIEEQRKFMKTWIEQCEVLNYKKGLILHWQNEIKDKVEALKLYEQYLNDVVAESSDEFKNPDSIITRFESLLETKLALAERQITHLGELETARAKMTKRIEESSLKILGLSNKISELNSRYNLVSRQALQREGLVIKVKKCIYNRYEELGRAKQSCWGMYSLMCRRKEEVLKIKPEDFEQQLIYIKETLRQLNNVMEVIKRRDVNLSKK